MTARFFLTRHDHHIGHKACLLGPLSTNNSAPLNSAHGTDIVNMPLAKAAQNEYHKHAVRKSCPADKVLTSTPFLGLERVAAAALDQQSALSWADSTEKAYSSTANVVRSPRPGSALMTGGTVQVLYCARAQERLAIGGWYWACIADNWGRQSGTPVARAHFFVQVFNGRWFSLLRSKSRPIFFTHITSYRGISRCDLGRLSNKLV